MKMKWPTLVPSNELCSPKSSKTCLTDLLIGQADGGISSTEILFQVTLAYVKLTKQNEIKLTRTLSKGHMPVIPALGREAGSEGF